MMSKCLGTRALFLSSTETSGGDRFCEACASAAAELKIRHKNPSLAAAPSRA
jgi:hypothetical protein